jgi:hypothetical protein
MATNTRLNYANVNPMNNPAFLSNMNPLLGLSNKENEPRPLKDPTKSPLYVDKDKTADVTTAYKKLDFSKKLNDPTYDQFKPPKGELTSQLGDAALKSISSEAGKTVTDELGKKALAKFSGEAVKEGLTTTVKSGAGLWSLGSEGGKSLATLAPKLAEQSAAQTIKVAAPAASSLTAGTVDAGMQAVNLGASTGATGATSAVGSTVTSTATTTGKTAATAATAAGGASKLAQAGTSLGIGLLGTAMDIYGQHLNKKSLAREDLKGYGASKALSWAGKGASWGATLGSVVPGLGTLLGAGIGAAVGGIAGGIAGTIQKKKILRTRENEKKAVEEQNKAIEARNQVLAGRTQDLVNQQRYMQDSENLVQAAKNGGLLVARYNFKQENRFNLIKPVENNLKNVQVFKMGGAMQAEEYINFASLEDKQKEEYLMAVQTMTEEGEDIETISTKTKLHPKVVYSLQKFLAKQQERMNQYKKGGKVTFHKDGSKIIKNFSKPVSSGIEETSFSKPTSVNADIMRKGGKVKLMKKKVASCACGCTPKFRRGGQLDIVKQNVIIDGPSHDDFNNTGVKGDKGLPVVKMSEGGKAFKVAEIESGELVLNKRVAEVLSDLRKKLKSAKEGSDEETYLKSQIADLLHKELKDNTYDYSNLMS